MVNSNIHNLLSQWGGAQRQLPERNQVIKNEILSHPLVPVAKNHRASFRLPWASFAFTALAIAALIIAVPKSGNMRQSAVTSQTYQSGGAPVAMLVPEQNGQGAASLQAVPDNNSYAFKSVPPQPQDVPAADNRELLKTDYSADVQTRDVRQMAARLQTTVRGFNGRVDSISSANDQGYISFVIPADQLGAFKAQVKDIAGTKFYTEQLSAQNMLPQKVSLEDQQTQNTDELNQLTASRDQLTIAHNQTAASFRSQIASLNSQLQVLNNQIPADPNQAAQIDAQKQDLQNKIQSLKARLANENNNYNSQWDSYNSQISDAQSALDGLSKQTADLLNTVATVRGTIYISYISLWGIIGLYVSGYWIAFLLLIAAVIAYYIHRRTLVFPSPEGRG